MILLGPAAARTLTILLSLTLLPSPSHAARAQTRRPARAPVEILDGDRERDGLLGPVRRVRAEVADIAAAGGIAVEGPRALLEVTTYDAEGRRVANETYPVVGGAPAGQESYEYDERGRLRATVTSDERGAVVSRTVYEYVYDAAGNWVRMTASAAAGPGGEKFEPVEVTYRTIEYYPAPPPARPPDADESTADGVRRILFPNLSVTPGEILDAGVVNDMALSMPRPAYPIGGVGLKRGPAVVTVTVVVDETGRVILARALDGPHPLRAPAERAARRAGFLPFRRDGRPTKARGQLVYTFPFTPR